MSETCVFAWAGTEIYARAFFRELESTQTLDSMTPTQLQTFISEYGQQDLHDLAVIGMLARSDRVFVVSVGDTPHTFEDIGATRMAGSGGELLRRDLRRVLAQLRTFDANPDDDRLIWPNALNLLAAISRVDMKSAEYDSALFGGCFELAISNATSCGILNDYVIFFHDLLVGRNGDLSGSSLSSIYHRVDGVDALVERRSYKPDAQLIFRAQEMHSTRIPPVYSPRFCRPSNNTGFSRTGRIHQVALFDSDSQTSLGSATLMCPPENDFIARVVPDQSDFSVEIQSQSMIKVASDILAKRSASKARSSD